MLSIEKKKRRSLIASYFYARPAGNVFSTQVMGDVKIND